MKRITSLIIMVAIICITPNNFTWADSNSVIVTIPSFKVSVNDNNVDSRKLKYPLIEYQGITYFPLTWQWCRSLGLITGFTQKDGLYIADYIPEYQESLDSGGHQTIGAKFSASICAYPIYINGKKINNNTEEYPLLNFRNITYFPLTYRFVTEEFGWEESFSKPQGLKIYTNGSSELPSSGTHYNIESCYTLQSYREYAILEKLTEERAISTTPDGVSSDYVGRTFDYYKLNYANDTLTEIASKDTEDKPYYSGAVQGEDVSAQFTHEGTSLYYNKTKLIDLSVDAGKGNLIDTFYVSKHSANGLKAYLLNVYFTEGETSVPPPYTPCKQYAFIEKGDGTLKQIKSWPSDQRLSAVYPHGKTGIYLCSNRRISGCARINNGRGWICVVNSDFTETTLNGHWKEWNSLEAIGMDDSGNLYMLNTSFTDYDKFYPPQDCIGTVNPVVDGYYSLAPKGTLTKVYPFVRGDQVYVTPTGGIYIDKVNANGTMHLQTGTTIVPK